MDVVVSSVTDGVLLTPESGEARRVRRADFPEEVRRREAQPDRPRWVWDDTSRWYPELLAARVRVERCTDLRLCHAILRRSVLTAGSMLAVGAPGPWDRGANADSPAGTALFDLDDVASAAGSPIRTEAASARVEAASAPAEAATARSEAASGLAHTNPVGTEHSRQSDESDESVAEWALQREAVAGCPEPGRIRLLLAAESAGALLAAEMRFAGMPWREDVHDAILTRLLGPRPAPRERPRKQQELLDEARRLLDVADLNPDSPGELLKGLARGGVLAASTRSWELKKIDHPAIAPLLEYKKLSRLASANGWHWLETWVREGRFRPDYVVGGVVTGRWATSGGGALQLPKQIRGAAVADAGWKLVVADAAQLEPRILAAMAGDRDMVAAGAAGDLYAGIVASGAIDTREHAKGALLGAMYGATQGEGGRLMPQLARAYPKAIALVEEAARAGERGETVSTRLGRSSPLPGAEWRELQVAAYGEGSTDAAQNRARSYGRSWGRFTRNFIVQGTAAEWALCWMASLRRRLADISGADWFTDQPHLVFFLHDEVVVHCPESYADRVAEAVRGAAQDAGRLLFGDLPVDFPLAIAIVDDYGQAK